ncbi:MAG TPA: hypothetical protein VGF95_07875 [Solirubrobacteraceae bacterium]|jgi:hypothetical protein
MLDSQPQGHPGPAAKIDVHQHVWTQPLLAALQAREQLPFVRIEQGLTVLYIAGERPYVIDVEAESTSHRRELLTEDGVNGALICLSSPLGIEALHDPHAPELLDAYHRGALALGPPFGVWGAISIARLDAGEVDRLLELGCVGVSLPAGSLASVYALARLAGVLDRLSEHEAPLFVHPGPGLQSGARARGASLSDPLWWPAMTSYVADMQAAWLAFATAGRRSHPSLRVIFAMLAGLAPLHVERLRARGGPQAPLDDPLTFYESSSYDLRAVESIRTLVGESQLLYGSDRPVVDPSGGGASPHALDWSAVGGATELALGRPWRTLAPRDEAPVLR